MSHDLPYRVSVRLPGFDYSSPNWYYVTICTKNRQQLFVGADYHPPVNITYTPIGLIAKQYWQEIPHHYPSASLDQFVIMPNHIHGVIIIKQKIRADDNPPLHKGSGTLGAIVRGYKIGVTKWCRENSSIYDIWQRNYYEHIIRDEGELANIRQYIKDNPRNWNMDKLYVGADYHPPELLQI